MKFNPNTPIMLYAKESGAYVPGQGQTNTWALVESITKPETEEMPAEKASVFYCEWKGSFGDRAISAEAIGVKDSATIRTFYNPTVYEKLKTVQVVIVKNADSTAIVDGEPNKNNPNVYELWGCVDNVLEENQFMEFRVRRYEGL
ncbi:MAG: hypothetical protein K0S75_861 [Clostridia bacterium]|nr:hypothetical protein [Clostridia bacterium]